MEYLFRYEPEKYEQLLHLKIVNAKQYYIQCITDEQREDMLKKSNVDEIKDRMNWIMESGEMGNEFTAFVEKFETKLLKEYLIPNNSYRKHVDKENLEANFTWPRKNMYCKMYYATDEYFLFTPSGRETFTEQTFENAIQTICKHLNI